MVIATVEPVPEPQSLKGGDGSAVQAASVEVDYSMECAPIGATVKRALRLANIEQRLVLGLSEAVSALAKTPEEYLFCFMAAGDSATHHMHEVLLQAFCFEHDIYIIKVDSAEKLSRLLGTTGCHQSCALIQKSWSPDHQTEILSKVEDQLVDYCEEHWEDPVKPVIKLPEK
ncbi:uncharacterized protein LOC129750602 [Uranotaenia lowii]|uniref:uncharacterized protein LOC129750602 n=1 Tax=Uranotaenia lowii TaxID=190385 RepID=UPI0024793355|nr:uncharacterized protein LOC129750602 [Uranotaenia lowii]